MSTPVPASPAKDSPWMQMLVARAPQVAARISAPKEVVEETTPVQIESAVREVNAAFELRSIGLQFEIDRDTDKVIVKVIDRNSGEVIRQIPNEEVVRIAKVMGEMPGLLVDEAA